MSLPAPLLGIDIGNTHTHFGLVTPAGAPALAHLPTPELADPHSGIGPHMRRLLAEAPHVEAIAFCSVVPDATARLRAVLAELNLKQPVFQLTHEKRLGVPIGYPRPAEIGQDRLANAAAAVALVGAPAVVIDMGTAVTFDVVTRAQGYEGGIIAPGVELMRRYLHEQTALLPALDESIEIAGPIGRSTVEAMRIGTVLGFGGMIRALLDAVSQELIRRGEPMPAILTTGGSAALVQRSLPSPHQHVPDLTLRGLAAAWQLNR